MGLDSILGYLLLSGSNSLLCALTHIMNKLYYYWLMFQRYGLCIDIYLSKMSGNQCMLEQSRMMLAEVDTQIDLEYLRSATHPSRQR